VKHFLISRTDNIGDVVLSLPLIHFIKKNFPDAKLSFLGKGLVSCLVHAYGGVDEFVSYEELQGLASEDKRVRYIKNLKIDTVIHAYPRRELARLFWLAGVACRVGTSRRFYHWYYCNRRPDVSRKKSVLHESQLNLKLLEGLGLRADPSLNNLKSILKIKPSQKEKFRHLMHQKKFNLVVHPGSRGSSRHWGLQQFIDFINALDPKRFKVFITGDGGEKKSFRDPILSRCSYVVDAFDLFSLKDFINFLSLADGFVSGSTGPLHLAAGLGVNSLGLYPLDTSLGPRRWGPVGQNAEALCPVGVCRGCRFFGKCTCMTLLKKESVLEKVQQWSGHEF
tara:strand:- start:1765 stop:2775 length:1011 start_codon:yes stop_codon:yes gene_type:complete